MSNENDIRTVKFFISPCYEDDRLTRKISCKGYLNLKKLVLQLSSTRRRFQFQRKDEPLWLGNAGQITLRPFRCQPQTQPVNANERCRMYVPAELKGHV